MEFLVRELAELREMLVGMKITVTGHGLDEKGGETGDREVGRLEEQEKGEGFLAPDDSLAEENWNGKVNAGHSSSEDRDTDIEIQGEHGTEEEEIGRYLMDGKETRPGTQMLATHSYRENDEARRQRALVAGRGWKGTGGICAIGLYHVNHR